MTAHITTTGICAPSLESAIWFIWDCRLSWNALDSLPVEYRSMFEHQIRDRLLTLQGHHHAVARREARRACLEFGITAHGFTVGDSA